MIHEKNLKQKISWNCPFKPKCPIVSASRFRYLVLMIFFWSLAVRMLFCWPYPIDLLVLGTVYDYHIPLISRFNPFDPMIISPWSIGSLPLIWWSYPNDLMIISPCIHAHKPFVCWSYPDLKILSHWSDDHVPQLKESNLCSVLIMKLCWHCLICTVSQQSTMIWTIYYFEAKPKNLHLS